jgi:hypothetical protein
MSAATKFLVVLIAVMAIAPTTAAIAADATLYELSEEMMVVNGHRKATASFQGTAELGTPLCPQTLVSMLNLPVQSCTVTGVGSDDVDINPASPNYGTGVLQGTFAVVVNADNVVDAPEYVVMTGRFGGAMSLAAAAEFTGKKQTAGPATQRITLSSGAFIPENIAGMSPESLAAYVLTNGASVDASRYDPAAIAGVVQALGIGPASFSGVFRLPFAVSNGHKEKARKDTRDAYYLGDNDKLIKVRKDEMALGYPTVRIEVTFGR